MKLKKSGSVVALATVFGVCCPALAFEDTRVMPAKIRRLTLRVVTTNIADKTSSTGGKIGLASPLEKDLTYKDIIKSEKDPVKKALTAGFVDYQKTDRGQAVGTFRGDIKTRVTVFAPVFTYGLTNRITLAAALPVYNMATSVGLGFQSNQNGQQFLGLLSNNTNNQTASAREAAEKINNAVGRLNDKLQDNGYRRLNNWQATGMGDLQLLTKGLIVDDSAIKFAMTGGVVAPTGGIDDPDNLLDKGFGDGQWDLFGKAALDEPLSDTGLTLNQYASYTVQLPGQKTVRLVTSDETIEVEKRRVAYKLGDKVQAGTSLQFADDSGFSSGMGYNYHFKFADIYKAGATSKILQKDTLESAHEAEFEIAYSTVPAFQRKQIAVPMESKLSYKRQLASRNMPVTHFIQLDTGIFF